MGTLILQLLILAILLLYPAWRICQRAGLNPYLSLTILIPYIGLLVYGIILAVSDWRITPRLKGKD
jgi:hypothetical protein